MVNYSSRDPYRDVLIRDFDLDHRQALEDKLKHAQSISFLKDAYKLESRLGYLQELIRVLEHSKLDCAEIISREVGKPIKEARGEVEKCIWLCHYYLDHAREFLEDQSLDLGEALAIRRYEPLGLVLGIMPWNFPFWQVFRFAVPAILAGNRALLKHAPNCQLSAEKIIDSFKEAGFPLGTLQNIRLDNDQVAKLIARPEIKGLSLTGSEAAGRAVAKKAAEALKPQVLELGGSNAFILHKSADLKKAVQLAAQARLMNAGQSCIAAKRFLVPENLAPDFIEALRVEFQKFNIGNPLEEGTKIGPLARKDLKEKALEQMREALDKGAQIICGGDGPDLFIKATILTGVKADMKVFKEEVFAPIASVMTYTHWEEAIAISNKSDYGLGVSLIGEETEFLLGESPKFEEGAVFINDLVKSDPRLPFGGLKNSGYGRELGPEGLRAFTNLKTIYLAKN